MTRAEILAMPAGRDMDALIAEKIFGWSDVKREPGDGIFVIAKPAESEKYKSVPFFSTDIAAAWVVVERFKEIDLASSLNGTFWVCTLGNDGENYFTCSKAETAPLAVCRAALLAVME